MLKLKIAKPKTIKVKYKTHFPDIISANLQEKEVEPTTETQIIEADYGYDGLKQVEIKPIPSEYIKPTGTKEIIENGIHNVKEFENVDVNISYTPNYQEKTVIPIKDEQEIIADDEYDALEKVIVKPIPSDYIIPSGELEITENGNYDVTDKASVNVEISGGGDLSEYFYEQPIKNYNYSSKGTWSELIKKIPPFDASNVTNFEYLFAGYSGEEIDLSQLVIPSAITSVGFMFYNCINLKKADCTKLNISNIQSMAHLFSGCTSLTEVNLSNLDTQNLTIMQSMFYGCTSLIDLDLSSFDTSNVTNMYDLFYDCIKLANLDLTHFDTSNVNNMYSMFYNCNVIERLDLSSFDTSKVTNMSYMFSGCKRLMYLDIRNFDFTNVTNYTNMFGGLSSTRVPSSCLIIVKDDTAKSWITSNFARWTNIKTVAEYEAQ